jgi:hypothetical protein
MSTNFIDAISETDVGARETALEALSAAPVGVERDVRCLHAARWQPSDDSVTVTVPTFIDPAAFRDDALATQLAKLHSALTSFTHGTVVMRFFDAALTDSVDAIFNARARRDESWMVEAARFSGTPSRAWRTFEELARWIGIGKVRTAREVLGISRGTTNAWKMGGEPQPSNARRLYRTHTIVKTLVRRLGLEGARSWLETGDPSPLRLLASGEFTAFDHAASALVFDGGAQESERIGAFTPEPVDVGDADARMSAEGASPRRLQRRPPRRRAR